MSSWNPEREAQLLAAVGTVRPVAQGTVATVATTLEVSARSVSSKLRKMGVEVDKVAARSRVFSDAQADALGAFLNKNSEKYTYAEIADKFSGGEFTAKQVQGKVLSMELTHTVKATPKPETTKTYTDEQENVFVKMAQAGKYLEEIADALGRSVASARGKALSLTRMGVLASIPAQRDKVGKKEDPIAALGDISKMTVAEIATATGKTERGIRVIITRRNLTCADYKAKAKKEKAAD